VGGEKVDRAVQQIERLYGETTDLQDRSGDTKIKSLKLGDLGEGIATSDIARQGVYQEDVARLEELLKPLLKKYPKMAELTVEEYRKLNEDPESFATSNIMRDAKI
jgi:hypothetical protein